MKTSLARQGLLRVLLAGAAAMILTGCVLPVPVTSHVESGTRLQPKQTLCIRPGQTTRADVIAALGTNYVTFRNSRAIAYTWEQTGGGGVWWVPGLSDPAGTTWMGGWQSYLIAIDERDVVRAAEFKRLSAKLSLDENMERWIARLPPVPPPVEPPSRKAAVNPLPAPPR